MIRNQHGLSRHIPADVKREVQRRCGHGCIFCGATIVEYEHFLPDFADAADHDPSQIALLCPGHHAKVTKGLIPKGEVAEQLQNPKALSQGYSHEEHPWFRGVPTVIMSGATFTNTPTPIQVHGENLLSFKTDDEGGPARISGSFRTALGGHMLEIVENEWRVKSGPWAFENVGSRYRFTYPGTEFGMILNLQPPHRIVVEKLVTISANGMPIVAAHGLLKIGGSTFQAMSSHGNRVGMAF